MDYPTPIDLMSPFMHLVIFVVLFYAYASNMDPAASQLQYVSIWEYRQLSDLSGFT